MINIIDLADMLYFSCLHPWGLENIWTIRNPEAFIIISTDWLYWIDFGQRHNELTACLFGFPRKQGT